GTGMAAWKSGRCSRSRMRSEGGSSEASVLGSMIGLSASADVLALFGPCPSPRARASAEQLAASTPKCASLMVVPLLCPADFHGWAAGRAQWYPSRPFDARPVGQALVPARPGARIPSLTQDPT